MSYEQMSPGQTMISAETNIIILHCPRVKQLVSIDFILELFVNNNIINSFENSVLRITFRGLSIIYKKKYNIMRTAIY